MLITNSSLNNYETVMKTKSINYAKQMIKELKLFLHQCPDPEQVTPLYASSFYGSEYCDYLDRIDYAKRRIKELENAIHYWELEK